LWFGSKDFRVSPFPCNAPFRIPRIASLHPPTGPDLPAITYPRGDSCSYNLRMLRIVVERAGEIVHDDTFRKAMISCGRDAANDIVLEAPYISSHHFLIKEDQAGSAFRIFDQSYNGTYWEGERIKTLRFDSATVVKIADFQLTLIPFDRSGTAESASTVDQHAPTVLEDPDELTRTGEIIIPGGLLGPAELRSAITSDEGRSAVFRDSATIGRSRGSTLQFSSRGVSRRHGVISAGPSGWMVRRTSLKNGLSVNHHELAEGQSVPLQDGDVLRFCDEDVLFLCPGPRSADEPAPSLPAEGSPNLDLAVNRRVCSDPVVAAFDVVGFLGTKTVGRFETEMEEEIRFRRPILLDLGYLIGLDGSGLTGLGRVIQRAEKEDVPIQLIRVTPRIADLLSFSSLRRMLTRYFSSDEESAIRKLRSS